MEAFLLQHKPVRIGVQIAHRDVHLTKQISETIETVASVLNPRPNVVLLATTDDQKLCTDLRHASHYQCQVLIHVGPACACQDRAETIPVFYISTQALLKGQTTTTSWSSKVIADAAEGAIDMVWVMGSREHPITETQAHSLTRLYPDTNWLISQQTHGYHWHSMEGDGEDFHHHINDDDCNYNVRLIFLGDEESPFFRCLVHRYHSCLEAEMVVIDGDNIHRVVKPHMSFANRRVAYLGVLKCATRVGIITTDRLTNDEEVTRKQIKRLLRSRKLVVVQICLDPVTDAKLENFADCDCFVFVGCPSRALWLLDKAKEYRRQVLMPREVLINFDLVPWTTHFSLEQLTPLEEKSLVEDETLVEEECKDLVAVQEGRALAVMGGHSLLPVDSRSFKGVNEEGWCEDSRSIHQGRFGIASYYVNEETHKKT